MVATVTKFSFTATLVCVAMLWHGSLQMPTHARTTRSDICDRKLQSPNVERDLLLGLYTMYRGIFTNARSDVDTQNPIIEIKNTSEKFQNISNSLCSFMMYSDFLEASSSKNSTKLQALQIILQENIKDGCTLLKNQSATSNQVNFTTVQGIEDNTHNRTAECSGEDLESLRVHCLEQSLLQRFLKAPYYDVYRAISDIDCLNTKKGKCGWIERRFQEPERSIVVELADLSCSASK